VSAPRIVIFGGQRNSLGKRQNIAESFALTYDKILGKFFEFKIGPDVPL